MPKTEKKYPMINREISWLHFNDRVLQEASDDSTPLIEKLKFLGIFSNNRDEFFRVRVATLNRMLRVEQLDYKIKQSPAEILQQIYKIVADQEKVFTLTYQTIVEELKQENVFIINEKQLLPEQSEFVTEYFLNSVRPFLFPIMIDNLDANDDIEDRSIYLAIHMQSSGEPDHEDHAVIRLPTDQLSRFLILPEKDGKTFIMLLDDVVRHGLNYIFSIFGYDTFQAYTFKITRDAELDLDNDVQKSFLEIMAESIKQREQGCPVRFVYDNAIPKTFLKKIRTKLHLLDDDNQRGGGRYHNFKDFMDFPKVGSSKLVYPPMPPMPHPGLTIHSSILNEIRKRDIMLHYPYQSFQYIVDLLREASIDPDVRSIKMTFYRAASNSNVMNALMNAARNGKSVTVFLEIQARFDEEANIFWAERLQKTGVKILPTIQGLKVHGKLILIRRKENQSNVYYANISTGNYNESTAKVYADKSLLTADQDIATDVYKVFQLFESRYFIPKFKKLIVSPFETRDYFVKLINREIKNAKEGKEAWMVLKLNSLVDKKLTYKLYEASNAGVKIKIIARGICVLIPGLKGISENIEAFSIVDRFLEHSRVYVFCNGGNREFFISSADWMQRNLDYRIEVTTPITDPKIQDEIWNVLQIQLHDNTKARLISADNVNQYRKTSESIPVRSQFETYRYFKKLLEQNGRLKTD
ncbi:MAG TPA: polyphosphate kinase 1 [Bacteroidales bacterium]|nr:polyphosphate kinase 1 [Bacteroidales bacterium]